MQVDGLQPGTKILATPSPRQSVKGTDSKNKEIRTPVQQKHGSITYIEYRENCSAINKLSDTIKLFLEVNKDLIDRENEKKAAKKGRWRSSK